MGFCVSGDSSDLIEARHEKLRALREAGIDPYGNRFEVSHQAAHLRENVDDMSGKIVRAAGRLMAIRSHGKITFADLMDQSGTIQLYFGVDEVGADAYDTIELLDIGDIVGVSGEPFRTRMEEPSIKVGHFEVLSKSLRPLPEKWHGLTDVDLRYRYRYLDLMVNPRSRDTFVIRSRVLSAMRRYLDAEGFMEVETPVMTPIAGGAMARPFVTHHNALDMKLYLRIATELYLKRLVTGGFEKVYEIGKVFRNEGISTVHNPEYTLLELYQAYGDYEDMMRLTEEMFNFIAREVHGSSSVEYGDEIIDFSPPWRRLSLIDALEDRGVEVRSWRDDDDARAEADAMGIEVSSTAGRGKVMDEMVEELVMPDIVQPTFLMDHPVDISPLAKRKEDDPYFTYRFEPVIGCMEVGNAFSELNDPHEQRRRFEEQMRQRRSGDEEAHVMDEDFLMALEYGMPPTGGLGIGVDRLVMLLTDARSIRDVLLFPLMRPRADSDEDDEEDEGA